MTESPVDESYPSCKSGNAFAMDTRLSAECLEQGELAFRKQRFLSAELCSLAAISARPDNHAAYHLLGRVLENNGHSNDAMVCYGGQLPKDFDSKLGLVKRQISEMNSTDFRRAYIHPVATNQFECPEFSGPVPRPEFTRKNYQTKPTWVDTLDGGFIWHDGHNTMVCDSSGDELADHRVGNVSLVNKLTNNSKAKHLGARAILLGARGCGNYYHWMTDIIPKLGLLEQAGIDIRADDIFILPRLSTRFQTEVLEMLGISTAQVYQTHKYSPWVTADNLVVPYLCNTMSLTMGEWVPHFLQLKFSPSESGIFGATNKIFVARDPEKSGGRRLSNHQEVVEEFKGKGFKVVIPEDHSIAEQVKLFSAAQVIAAPHGAGLTNILFCKRGTKVIEYFGEHLAPCYWAICNLLGLQYTPVDCRGELELEKFGETEEARTLVRRRQSGFGISKQRINEL